MTPCTSTLSTDYATWTHVDHCNLDDGHLGPHESDDRRWDDR